MGTNFGTAKQSWRAFQETIRIAMTETRVPAHQKPLQVKHRMTDGRPH